MSRRRTIKLMLDWGCDPLWEPGSDAYYVGIENLPLSATLKTAIREWAAAYDATLDQDSPPDSRFATPEAEFAHDAEGLRLWRELRSELRGRFDVVYQSRDGRLLESD